MSGDMDKSKENSKKKDPKVVVFGREVGDWEDEEFSKKDRDFKRHFHYHRPQRHSSFLWGFFFILIGLLFLLSNFAALPPVVWSQVARLWPILIILIGLDVLMGHSLVSEIVSSLVGIFILITIFGVILVNVSPDVLSSLPVGLVNYFHNVSSFLQLK